MSAPISAACAGDLLWGVPPSKITIPGNRARLEMTSLIAPKSGTGSEGRCANIPKERQRGSANLKASGWGKSRREPPEVVKSDQRGPEVFSKPRASSSVGGLDRKSVV